MTDYPISPAVRRAFDALRRAEDQSDLAFSRVVSGAVQTPSAAVRLARIVEERKGDFDHAVYTDPALDALSADPGRVYDQMERR